MNVMRLHDPNHHTLEYVTAVILAGGLGTRLREAVSDRPKVLAQINDRPFLAYQLDQLAAADIRQVVLCTGYMGNMVREAFGNVYKTIALTYSQEPEPLGTAGALRLALHHIKSDPILILNGDSYTHIDLEAYSAWYTDRYTPNAIALISVDNSSRYGCVEIDAQSRITSFVEKTGAHVPGLINAGVYLLRREVIAAIPSGRVVSLEREIFPELIEKGLFGYTSHGRFIDIGTPESYQEASNFFAMLRKEIITPNTQTNAGG